MRDRFWYKTPYFNKFDLTELGHFSGTGILTFNNNIKFEVLSDTNESFQVNKKTDYNSNWTLVTAYFNLTKCKDASNEINQRDSEYYKIGRAHV